MSWPRRLLLILPAAAFALLAAAALSPPRPLPEIAPAAAPGGPAVGGRALEEESLELDQLPASTLAEINAALASWAAFEAKLPVGSDLAEIAQLRVQQLEQSREALAQAELRELQVELEGLMRSGREARCQPLIDAFVARFAGTELVRHDLAARLAWVPSRLDAQRRPRFSWQLDFARRLSGEAIAGARFAEHHEALSIDVAEGLVLEHRELRFKISGGSRLDLSFSLAAPLPVAVELQLEMGAATNHGVAHARSALRVNERVVYLGWTPVDGRRNAYRWPIRDYLRPGKNVVSLRLERQARTYLAVFAVAVEGFGD